MKDLNVNKERLIAKIKENREEHQGIVARAQERYRERVIEELDKRLADAKAGRRINIAINLPMPTNYTEQYDIAIAQFEWERDEWVVLDPMDFNRFVLNKWEWAQQFAGTSLAYANNQI